MEKKEEFKLYLWDGILSDYTDGLAFAIARNVREARKIASQNNSSVLEELEKVKPEVHKLNKPFGLYIYGGS